MTATAIYWTGKPAGAGPAIIGLALLAASFAPQDTARAIPSPYAPAAMR